MAFTVFIFDGRENFVIYYGYFIIITVTHIPVFRANTKYEPPDTKIYT